MEKQSLIKKTWEKILAAGGSAAQAGRWALSKAMWPVQQLASGAVYLLSKTVVPAVSWVRNTIPGAKYVTNSFAIVLGVNFVVLPAVTFLSTVAYGVGYAVLATSLSIPAYCLLLATSLTPWASLGCSTLLIAGIWCVSDYLGYVIDWMRATPIKGEEILEPVA